MKPKTPTNKEKIATYEDAFAELHFHTHVSNNAAAHKQILRALNTLAESKNLASEDAAFWELHSLVSR